MKRLEYKQTSQIGHLILNRPDKYNAVDAIMLEELEQFWNDRMYDESVRVILLSGGSSKGFCGGLDLEAFGPKIMQSSPTQAYDYQARMSRLQLAMRRIPQPIIACVHGAAAGLGFSFAMASDVRILAENARFSAAYINIGLGGADMASSYFLPRQIGAGRAYELLLTGDWLSAEQALSLGFASRLVTQDELLPTGQKIAETMISKNPLGLRMTKEAINMSLDAGGLEACLQMEDRNQIMITLANKLAQYDQANG